MSINAVVRARIDENIKNEAARVLADMGLTISDACRITLTAVARDKAFPFDINIPNKKTLEAMQEIEEGKGTRFATPEDLFKDLGI